MTERRLLDDCFLHDKDRLRHHEVLDHLRRRLTGVCDTETAPLGALSGRVLAADVVSLRSVPPHDNAAVDGYAFSHAGYEAKEGKLRVAMRLAAGDWPNTALQSGEAARIFTGAFLPAGADTVAMQEDCVRDGDIVTVPPGLKPGANRRRAGEDVTSGDRVAKGGQRLTAADIGALASQGLTEAPCFKPLRIAVFSTGDEIVEPGNPATDGQIYDSNRAMLMALLDHWPGRIVDMGRLPDNRESVAKAIQSAAADHDLIVTSGGASRGEEDHIVEVLDSLGKRHLWQLAIKPGRPLTLGQIGDTAVFGLPGNPVAVFVCALLYLRPAIHVLQGADWPNAEGFILPARFSMKKKPDRREFLRGILAIEGGVAVGVDKFARDGSGLISGLRAADGLIEIGEDVTAIAPGDPVIFRPFSAFGIT